MAQLVPVDTSGQRRSGSCLSLTAGVTLIGRNTPPQLGITDKTCSRKQIEVEVKQGSGKEAATVILRRLGTNPSYVLRHGHSDPVPLEKGEATVIAGGDILFVVVLEHGYKLELTEVNQLDHTRSSTNVPEKSQRAGRAAREETAAKEAEDGREGGRREEADSDDIIDEEDVDGAKEENDDVLNDEIMASDEEEEHEALPPCKYGASCYRKNPRHLKQFSHPKKKNWQVKKRSREETSGEPPAKRPKRAENPAPSKMSTATLGAGNSTRHPGRFAPPSTAVAPPAAQPAQPVTRVSAPSVASVPSPGPSSSTFSTTSVSATRKQDASAVSGRKAGEDGIMPQLSELRVLMPILGNDKYHALAEEEAAEALSHAAGLGKVLSVVGEGAEKKVSSELAQAFKYVLNAKECGEEVLAGCNVVVVPVSWRMKPVGLMAKLMGSKVTTVVKEGKAKYGLCGKGEARVVGKTDGGLRVVVVHCPTVNDKKPDCYKGTGEELKRELEQCYTSVLSALSAK